MRNLHTKSGIEPQFAINGEAILKILEVRIAHKNTIFGPTVSEIYPPRN